MTAGSTEPENSEPPQRRIGQWVKDAVAGPLAAVVGVVAAVAQIIDYVQDGKAEFLWLAVAALAAACCLALGWHFRSRVGSQLASVGWSGVIVYGSALVGTLSLASAAGMFVLATDRPPAPLPPSPSSSAAVPPPSPTALSTTPTPSVPPLADGVTCGSGAPEKVSITSVYSADGGPELSSDVVVALAIRQPPAEGSYWLMVYADDVPRNLHFVWKKLAPGDTEVRHTITADVGSHREIYVAQSSADSDAWFAENLGRDRDSKWDGNRVELPPGAQKVSNTCDAVRKQ